LKWSEFRFWSAIRFSTLQIKSFVKEISVHLSFAFLVQAFTSSVVLCTSVFLLTMVSFKNSLKLILKTFFHPQLKLLLITFQISPLTETPHFIRTLFYTFSKFFQIFVPCYYGNEVMLASQKPSSALFYSNWIKSNQKYKKSMKIFLENLKNPIKVIAVDGLVNIDFGTFRKICNSAYSLYALFKKINQ
jgi:hypothetical protein